MVIIHKKKEFRFQDMQSIARGFYRKFLETDDEKLVRKEKELENQYRKLHKKSYTSVMTELTKYHHLVGTVRSSLDELVSITRCIDFFDDKMVRYPKNTRSSS